MNIDFNNIDSKLLEEDDRIVAYLKGKMSAEEEIEFLKELEDNQELRERAIATARLVKGLKDAGSEQDSDFQRVILASRKQDVDVAVNNATLTKAKVFSFVRSAKWLSIAASVFFIVWLGLTYYTYRNTTALGNQYDDVFTSDIFVRGQETQTEAEKKLLGLFSNIRDNKKIDETIHELTLCWELSTMDTYNDYTDFSAEIGWNLAIAHLKNNDRKEAQKVLEKIISISEEDSSISLKAKELLGQL